MDPVGAMVSADEEEVHQNLLKIYAPPHPNDYGRALYKPLPLATGGLETRKMSRPSPENECCPVKKKIFRSNCSFLTQRASRGQASTFFWERVGRRVRKLQNGTQIKLS